jgi:hypothetical protein
MIYEVTKWKISDLLKNYEEDLLNLSPVYQRNFIWSIKDQQHLIESIKKNNPIPNFFLIKKESGKLEMVDGQQRSRTILGFIKGQFKDLDKKFYKEEDFLGFLNYTFPVTIISDTQGESIENFYAIVNKTGIHLNKPEVRKADYYDTNLLKLINKIADFEEFNDLKLFTKTSLKRMNNVDFVTELIVLMLKGHIEKKTHIDSYFETDITDVESRQIENDFRIVLGKIELLNNSFEISKTRYRQRNDFYTLFDFINKNKELDNESLLVFYKVLVLIAADIKPSQEYCKPLMEYARNCVTQSNSKTSRENRLTFFNELFLNKTSVPNQTQIDILEFYNLDKGTLEKVNDFFTISAEGLNAVKLIPFKV